jgi:glycosyltransferase involved in cell wall biosynthesis
MRLVVVTQQVDPASAVLGATVDKLRALAARVDELVVLADGAVEGALPENSRVRLFRSRHRAGRGLRFESALAAELARRPRPAAVLAHMCPIYAVLAAPLARPARVKVLLWFTHWRRSRLLAAATRASTTVLSVDERTFPRRTRKLVAIGHGIDVSGLACVTRPERKPLTLLALGRTSPAKGLETIVRAVGQVQRVGLRIVGPATTEEERLHKIALERLVIDLRLLDRVDITGPVPRHAVPDLYAHVDALVNDMRPGATDKVVYEAAATCLPVIASNPAFDTLLPPELRFEHGDVDGLAAAIAGLRKLDRNAIGRTLRETVVRDHSVDVWADRVVELAARA